MLRAGAGNSRHGESAPFTITAFALERGILSRVAHWFKATRCSGRFDRQDRSLPVDENGSGGINAHGGWYAATETSASTSPSCAPDCATRDCTAPTTSPG
ncbi:MULTISPECIES: hypothetical protein [unclassified Actinopolyspora]|uniref:hypothetical protein n=1 Tax=unclassified Actinopolyspora TaxID=2639451 RepID=UPI001A991E49|nr:MULTISPECIES: hypothetical protein [unclassified Actinopolyspora]